MILDVRCAKFWRGDYLWWDEADGWRIHTIIGLKYSRAKNGKMLELFLGPVAIAIAQGAPKWPSRNTITFSQIGPSVGLCAWPAGNDGPCGS